MGATLGLAACGNGDNNSADNAKKNQMPRQVENFINENFAGVDVDTFWTEDDDLEVKLSNGTEIGFGINDQWTKLNAKKNGLNEEQLNNLLPTKTSKYLASNHAGQAVKKIKHKQNGYVITLSAPEETLYFDKYGKLSNQPQELPSNAKIIIEKYFESDTVAYMVFDDNQMYEVEMNSGVELYFDRTGNLDALYTNKSALPHKFIEGYLPKSMVEYLERNYEGRAIKRITRKNYGISVKLGKTKEEQAVVLRFSKSGNFIRTMSDD